MAGGKSNKPLFELLGEEVKSRRSSAAAEVVEAASGPATPATGTPSAPSSPGAGIRPTPRLEAIGEYKLQPGKLARGDAVLLPKAALWIAAAAAMFLGFTLYGIGFLSGRTAGKKEMAEAAIKDKPVAVVDPTVKPPGTLPDGKSASPPAQPTVQPPSRPSPTPPAPQPTAVESSASRPPARGASPGLPVGIPDDGTKPVILSTGAVDADPRQPGLNYLVIATLIPRDKARELVAYLAQNGLEAAAIYDAGSVDRARRSGNNSDPFKVVVLSGVGKGEHKKDSGRAVEDAVRNVAPGWKATKVGRDYDITRWYWEQLR